MKSMYEIKVATVKVNDGQKAHASEVKEMGVAKLLKSSRSPYEYFRLFDNEAEARAWAEKFAGAFGGKYEAILISEKQFAEDILPTHDQQAEAIAL